MNLFRNKNNPEDLTKSIDAYAKSYGFGLVSGQQHWILFEKDEMKVKIKFVEINNQKKIEFTAPLFEGISTSLEVFVRPICGEKFIRDIAKTDLIGKCGDKLELIRYIKADNNSYGNMRIEKNINSILRRAKKLQQEISSLLDYLMFIKLN